MANEITNIKDGIQQLNQKLDNTFVTKTGLKLHEQRIDNIEKSLTRVWNTVYAILTAVVTEIIRTVIHFLN